VVALRRGFKAEAERTALEVRTELSLAPFDPLDPHQLAAHLEIPVEPLAFVEDEVPSAVWYLRELEPGEVSAVTIVSEAGWLILYNDGHSPARQASDIMHELGHGLLLHPAAPALDEQGRRRWNAKFEQEAAWLGGALLVPEQATIRIARQHIPPALAAQGYGVSEQMMRWRLQVTGAIKRAEQTA
jgi:Zn-dependent peptidase ImmA (M78 family)